MQTKKKFKPEIQGKCKISQFIFSEWIYALAETHEINLNKLSSERFVILDIFFFFSMFFFFVLFFLLLISFASHGKCSIRYLAENLNVKMFVTSTKFQDIRNRSETNDSISWHNPTLAKHFVSHQFRTKSTKFHLCHTSWVIKSVLFCCCFFQIFLLF